ncbi:MAG TPA: zinc-dependent peptidase [Chitinophagaceae bacterium]|nr:zinc-dependent peptidase [Chitinophagaceae bacterium]
MIDAILITILVLAVLALIVLFIGRRLRRARPLIALPEAYRQMLQDHVPFYKALDEAEKTQFESRVQYFLGEVRITGVNTVVTDMDRVLTAASAIIPIFAFPGWQYTNLNEVLLYPETFSEEFEQQGNDRNVLGMVGTGAMQNVMILSQHELRQGFLNKTGKTNIAIHEFVHLVDKTDGAVDGIPENLMDRKYILPWLRLMQQKIQEIAKGRTDINPYGATNQAEFFAVASEYFFERPDLLKQKHPDLYQLLEEIFRSPQKN